MDRREFIKVSSLTAAAVTVPSIFLGGCSQQPKPGTGEVTATPTVCDICFWKCAGHVYSENGIPWKIVGNKEDLHSNGRLCTRGTGGMGAYLDQDRLKTPMVREVGKNGKQTFREASWQEALDIIAKRMQQIADSHGADRMAMLSHGAGASHFKNLLKGYGSNTFTAPSYAQCRGPREVAFNLTYGEGVGSPDRTDMEHSRCIVLIGSHIGENLHNGQVQTLSRALERGVSLITVDPRYSVPASKSQHWLPIKPGTDTALLLAWMNVLIEEDLYDKAYIEQHAMGFDELAQHVKQFPPEWAYIQTGLKPALIRETAREMAKNAPATLVHPGRHTTWYGDDTQRERAIAILNALLGSWGRPGGFYMQEKVKLPKYKLPEYPKAKSNFKAAHAGKFPFATQAVSNAVIDASIGKDAHYRGWMVYGTNLPMTVPGIRNKLKQAAESLDLIVVIDTMPAEITGYADVILPECTYLERYDDLRNSGERHPSLALRMPAFEPKYDSKPGWWIAKQLGEKLGLQKFFPWKDYSEVLDWQLQQVGSSLAEMQKAGVKNFPRKTPMYMQEGQSRKFRTPSGKIELVSSQLAAKGFDALPVYTPPPTRPDDYYHLNYGRMPAHTFSRTTNNPLLFELAPENALWVNPQIARQHGIKNGETVRLQNQDGVVSNSIRVRVTERIGPDSVFMAHGFGHRSKKLQLTQGLGADDSDLMTNVLIDPIMGATGMRGNFVTFVKNSDQEHV